MGRRSLLVAAGVAAALAVASATFAGAQDDTTRRGTDPLSDAEVQAARSAVPDASGSESQGTNGLPDRVVLLVERHLEDKGAADDRRRADVYEYDYTTDTLTVSVVDLDDGSVERSEPVQGTQLPLVEAEAQRALDLLFADGDFTARLTAELAALTGSAAPDPRAALDAQPIVFRADAVPAVAGGAATACGIHRCAQFLLQTTDHLLVDLFPVVDLSTGVILSADATEQP